RAGVRVAADDVGAGNAGLRLLSQFQFDVVKIDLSLVQGGTRAGGVADQTLSVLGSLVQMADRLGAVTIAEGVETAEQLRTIRDLGITAGQGYLLGRPGPKHDLAWLDLEALASRDEVPDPQSPFGPRTDPLRRPPTRASDRQPAVLGPEPAAELPGAGEAFVEDGPWSAVPEPEAARPAATSSRLEAVQRRSLPFRIGRNRPD
ncbi:MAG TPA: EAL domain-containing protein, partial [Candidatus Limnocylindrales bacterium]|nr:EAL domain-containing protein [Candidatus Limnocylindrales bacterium]